MADKELKNDPSEIKGSSFVFVKRKFSSNENARKKDGFEPSSFGEIPEDKASSWPMLYILTKDKAKPKTKTKYAYVGETTSVVTRMKEHAANKKKVEYRFDTANVIFNETFNKSVITHYENLLINLMSAEGTYTLTNQNDGMRKSNYFLKEEYSELFHELWDRLKDEGLAKGDIHDIEQTDAFKYSPYKSLTLKQWEVVTEICDAVKGSGTKEKLKAADPIMVEGLPGTGKTILAMYLLKTLKDELKSKKWNIRLMEPVPTLRKTLQKVAKNIEGLLVSDIIGPYDLVKERYGYKGKRKKSFDIVLVDEAHRLKQRKNLGPQIGNYDKVSEELGLRPKSAQQPESTQLDWIKDQVALPIFFYDPLQTIGPSCIEEKAFSATFKKKFKTFKLDDQMRVKGGTKYLDFVENLLDGKRPRPQRFDGYDLVLHKDIKSFIDSFNETYKHHKLARMLAGYAWKWETKSQKKKPKKGFDIEIKGIKLRWNYGNVDWVEKGVNDEKIAHEVGCIHSIQGYDLSYAYVIIGDDLKLDPETGKLCANRESYYDRNGHVGATDGKLYQYIRNIYYVLLTRGIEGTHIYVVDDELRDYLSKSFKHPEQIAP